MSVLLPLMLPGSNSATRSSNHASGSKAGQHKVPLRDFDEESSVESAYISVESAFANPFELVELAKASPTCTPTEFNVNESESNSPICLHEDSQLDSRTSTYDATINAHTSACASAIASTDVSIYTGGVSEIREGAFASSSTDKTSIRNDPTQSAQIPPVHTHSHTFKPKSGGDRGATFHNNNSGSNSNSNNNNNPLDKNNNLRKGVVSRLTR